MGSSGTHWCTLLLLALGLNGTKKGYAPIEERFDCKETTPRRGFIHGLHVSVGYAFLRPKARRKMKGPMMLILDSFRHAMNYSARFQRPLVVN